MDAIDRDLDLAILEAEYPRLKEALTINYAEIGYDEILRAINDISLHTYTASRLSAVMNFKYNEFVERMYEVSMAKLRMDAIKNLEQEWQEKKHKATLSEKRIDDYISVHFFNITVPLNEKKNKFERDLAILKSLHKRLENRESLLQTYSRLHQRKVEIHIAGKEEE